ncbi:flavodoxin domain-containing protein [Streptomyces griseosporeus]|uniref:flavodoxin domain-containing protein n=1 Tax=Streptomyces griseosporeus TaxID=1910 RepID=UPI0036FEC560
MNATVLVVHGSANGSTAQIADAVAAVLSKEGLTADTRPAGTVRDVSSYDAVVIGGALYAGRWHKDARRFARRHRRALAERPVWLFSSGPLDPSAGERDIPPVPGVRRVMERIDAREHITFGGRLEEGARGWVARMLLKNGKGGDFRDFDQIERWAARVAGELTGVRQEG